MPQGARWPPGPGVLGYRVAAVLRTLTSLLVAAVAMAGCAHHAAPAEPAADLVLVFE